MIGVENETKNKYDYCHYLKKIRKYTLFLVRAKGSCWFDTAT